MSENGFVGEPSEEVARALAQKGPGAIEHMQAIVNRAREITMGEIAAGSPDRETPRHAWEEMDDPPLDGLPGVWMGTVDDYATGEGLSVCFVASFAHSENAFRRHIAADLGRELANRAQVRKGTGSLPFASMFLSPSLRSSLAAFDRGEDRPATFAFVAAYRVNYS